jgi:putative proteasome-type protease
MFQAARLVGETLREVIAGPSGNRRPQADSPFSATLILGGQVRGGEPRLFMIYPEGNFVEASRRHALLPDRRDEIRQADPGARL